MQKEKKLLWTINCQILLDCAREALNLIFRKAIKKRSLILFRSDPSTAVPSFLHSRENRDWHSSLPSSRMHYYHYVARKEKKNPSRVSQQNLALKVTTIIPPLEYHVLAQIEC